MSIKELQAGANYEKFLETEFAMIPKKKSILLPQEEQVNRTDTLRLQVNITKNNLKELDIGPGLITQIVEDLKLVEGDLLEFNKYFPTFKSATSNNKIKSLADFRTEWSLFKDQQIGRELQPYNTINTITPEVKYTRTELENLNSEELDKLFKLYLTLEYKRPIDEIREFRYKTVKNELSAPVEIINKYSIITFGKGSRRGDTPKGYNELKIKYIYQRMYPSFNPVRSKDLTNLEWKGPQLLQGEGFKKKRRSGLMRYR